MTIFFNFLPVLLFIILYVGSGIYFTALGVENGFYQISPIFAIIPGIILAWIIRKEKSQTKMEEFIKGISHRDIITMCIIFLLAGAFSEVTKSIGSIEATVNMSLNMIPSKFLLIGLFLIAAFISTAIGTSMGTIATIAPLAAGICLETNIPVEIAIATVVSGAMFGDNLSLISDTTIASVMSQEADLKKKVRLNSIIACMASVVTIFILIFLINSEVVIEDKQYSLIKVSPYIFLIIIAVSGVNVFISLVVSIIFAWFIGFLTNGYDLISLGQDITKGFMSMHEIMLLSLMVGGLSGLIGDKARKNLTDKLTSWASKRNSKKLAQLLIAKIVSIFDILLANNTIAIIFSGEMAREIAKKFKIPSHISALWLDCFSCVFQGIIPYGAQILLASAIAGVSPLTVVKHVYYCFALGVICLLWIFFKKLPKETSKESSTQF